MASTHPDACGRRRLVLTLLVGLALPLLPIAPPRAPGQLTPDPKDAREKASPSHLGQNMALVKKRLALEYDSLEALYKHLHVNPELSLMEVRTAARLARELRTVGFTVTQRVGGHGVVGVFRNGKGPTVLVRTDMDALPIQEKTGLPYASTVRARDRHDREVPVMHACGHDMHMACWVGVARILVALKDRWHGTLVFIGQPAEEIGQGAKMMLQDGLYKNFPRPDYCLALHCDSQRAHGTVGCSEGPILANVDSVDITVRGKGGHGAHPHTTVDPIVLAARIVLDLQTLVSREINPTNPAVVTVGSFHGGTKHNIIPDEVHLQLTVRSTKDSVRKHLLDGIKRIAFAAAKGAGAPEPIVKFDLNDYTPALSNDVPLTRKLAALFRDVLGPENVRERPQLMGGEDFSRFGQGGVPLFLYFIGTVPPERVAEAARPDGKPLPGNHSPEYYPVIRPTLETGALTMTMAILELLH